MVSYYTSTSIFILSTYVYIYAKIKNVKYPKLLIFDETTSGIQIEKEKKILKSIKEYFPDIIVNLRPTSPLRSSIDIDICIEKLQKEENADSLRSISYAGQHPLKMWKIIKRELQPFTNIEAKKFYETINMPRQK